MFERRKEIRPRNFDEFLTESMKNDTGNLSNLKARDNWVNENKTQNILKKIPSDELPQCEDFEHSKVGDFFPKGNFEDLYDEDGEIIDGLGDNGILCYSFNDKRSWWQIKEEDGQVTGLCRIK